MRKHLDEVGIPIVKSYELPTSGNNLPDQVKNTAHRTWILKEKAIKLVDDNDVGKELQRVVTKSKYSAQLRKKPDSSNQTQKRVHWTERETAELCITIKMANIKRIPYVALLFPRCYVMRANRRDRENIQSRLRVLQGEASEEASVDTISSAIEFVENFIATGKYDDLVNQKDEYKAKKLNMYQLGSAIHYVNNGMSISDAVAKVKAEYVSRCSNSCSEDDSDSEVDSEEVTVTSSKCRNVVIYSDDDSEFNVVEEPRRKRRKVIEDSEDDD